MRSISGRGRGGRAAASARTTAASVVPAAVGLVGPVAGFLCFFRMALGGGMGLLGFGGDPGGLGLVFAGGTGLAAPAPASPAAAGGFLLGQALLLLKGKGFRVQSRRLGGVPGFGPVAGLLLFLFALPIGFQVALGFPGVAALVAALPTAAGGAALTLALVLF